ncbi:hypothetical protein A4D02_34975 [Niastella koreensis]|uniref:Uncharacterized conserved protein UCP016719 n=2 Tax=Niastella koreensis TaxID=354356 RepID=G8TP78_NIAKG|nr:DUF1343 domain-containing protein [Niastella koreensis]AEV96684.1 Uncharacterized conserved protein UCP016719 [Niastella koreensis GR20-10]OQP44343.1 hypothetical protein A4D02_34975 [Niastella koreensis]
MLNIQFGIDILLAQQPHWKRKRIALVTNHAATTNCFAPSRLALLQHGFNIVKLFSPEHGLDTTGADGHAMGNSTDPLTHLPVVSLYGDKLAPAPEDLIDIDVVLFDIPDIGSRFYTYLWTMTHVLEACAVYNLPFIVADRPNPVSGNLRLAEGPMLDEVHCSSFIGRWSIPVRHSCTMGELAKYFNATRNINCELEVIPCNYWQRDIYYTEWSHSFVPLSPAIPGFESALLYPGLCYLEATNCSEGRGTATPFRIAGAPWMQANETARLFNSMQAANANSVYARPIMYTPTEGKYVGQRCNGIMLHVTDPNAFLPVTIGWLLIRIIKELHPQHFQWATYPTHVNPSGKNHLDLLSGISGTPILFETALADFTDAVREHIELKDWFLRIQPHLMYI